MIALTVAEQPSTITVDDVCLVTEKPRVDKPTRAPQSDGILGFMNESDEKENSTIVQPDKPMSSATSELENYLDCRDIVDDPLEFWRTHKHSLPRLFEIVKQTLFASGSTTGIERIFSMAGYILNDRRTRTSDDNFENQLFANVNLDLSESRLRKKLKLK